LEEAEKEIKRWKEEHTRVTSQFLDLDLEITRLQELVEKVLKHNERLEIENEDLIDKKENLYIKHPDGTMEKL